MSHWFHRNPLKCTTSESFALSLVAAHPEAIQLCDRLKNSRRQLLDLLNDPSSDPEVVDKLLAQYLSLLMGFIYNYNLNPNYGPNDSSKLRHYIRFKWTDSLLGQIPVVRQDSVFELISICYEFAIWLTKHCSQLAAKPDLTIESAKECHKCLRKAAGVLTLIQTEWCDRLLDKNFSAGSDLDPRVMSAYIQQCQAEAQEVTIARAIEQKHSPTLVSALANETSKLFLSAAGALKALDQTKVGKWMTYFQLKSAFYESYAYSYLGDCLLAQEKCGEAIRALEESEKFYETAVKLCKDYKKIKGPAGGSGAKIDEHLFFRQLAPLVKRTKDKCVRENGFIYHHKVPKDCPPLELKATHGLVTPEEYSLPALNELWTAQSYSAFDLSKNITFKDPREKPSAGAKPEEPLPVSNEKPIKHSETDPKTQSGCQLQ